MRDISDNDGETLRQENPKPKSREVGKTPMGNLILVEQ